MKEPLPHDVLPWAGCTPWARAYALPAGNTWVSWKIRRNHPLNWEKTLFFILLSLFFLPSPVYAQEEIIQWFGPDIGRLKLTLNYNYAYYTEERVSGQNIDLQLDRHRGFILLPLQQSPSQDWSVSVNFRGQHINTEAILPDTREPFPDDLWDLRFGTQVRHRFENGWIGGGSISLGSASNRLFASDEEILLHATLFTRIPHRERNAWLVLLNYSKTREFLPHVPIPGFGYWYEPSDQIRMIAGVPFLFLNYSPQKEISFSFAYFVVRTIRAEAAYRPIRALRLYADFEWNNEHYFRAERQEEKDRLTYYEKRVLFGIQWYFYKQAFLDFSGGYAFDRFYFEGQDYSDRGKNHLDVADGPFLSLRAGFRH